MATALKVDGVAPKPAGWDDWHVSNSTGYAEFNYFLNDNGVFRKYTGPSNYGVDVLNSDAQSFIVNTLNLLEPV